MVDYHLTKKYVIAQQYSKLLVSTDHKTFFKLWLLRVDNHLACV